MHHMGMGVDAHGAFHPVWIDARTGVNQAWTATVLPSAPGAAIAGLSKQDVLSKMQLEFGVGAWDAVTETLTVPMRLHNASHDTLYPPFTINVTGTKNPYYKDSKTAVTILNADNGQAGVGCGV
jgi:hypothetical protein